MTRRTTRSESSSGLRPLRRWAATLAAVVGAACLLPAGASAATEIVLSPDGQARTVDNPFLSAQPVTPAMPRARPRSAHRTRVNAQAHTAAALTPAKVLVNLLHSHGITSAEYAHYRGDLRQTAGSLLHLSGTRKTELQSIVTNLNAIAAAGELTADRLPQLFLTLERNREWWTTGPMLTADQRVSFKGSELVWEYYPTQGIELQQLGSFGEADGYYTAGKADYPKLVSLLGELIPLAVHRAGGLAWEYDFNFDGGHPPWISAMTEGTAMEALTRAYKATLQQNYLTLAHQVLPVLAAAPPSGVSLKTTRGRRFLQYSFAPSMSIINAFLQTLIGLYDYSQTSGDATAKALFDAGNAEAEWEVPHFNTGAWSLYTPDAEDDLSYHELVTGFLQQLCTDLKAPVYCTTAQDFTNDLKTPPKLALQTTRAKTGHAFALHYHLDKYSHVGVVLTLNGATVFSTSADFGYGNDTFTVPALSKPGTYDVRLAATDLNGNFARITGTVAVTR